MSHTQKYLKAQPSTISNSEKRRRLYGYRAEKAQQLAEAVKRASLVVGKLVSGPFISKGSEVNRPRTKEAYKNNIIKRCNGERFLYTVFFEMVGRPEFFPAKPEEKHLFALEYMSFLPYVFGCATREEAREKFLRIHEAMLPLADPESIIYIDGRVHLKNLEQMAGYLMELFAVTVRPATFVKLVEYLTKKMHVFHKQLYVLMR